MDPIVVCLSGHIASGKSSVASWLVNDLGFAHFRLGEFLKQKAVQAKKPLAEYVQAITRDNPLQVLEMAISEIQSVAQNRPGVVIESVYRPQEVEFIRNNFPTSEVFLFVLEANKRLRIRRLAAREGIKKYKARARVRLWDSERAKYGQDALKKFADFVLSNELKTKQQVRCEVETVMKKRLITKIAGLIKKRPNLRK